MSMAKLAVELAKGAVKTYTAYPATIVIGYLIDLVTVQENAAKINLERIEGMVNDLQENPFRVGKLNLKEAKTIKDSALKKDRIIKALDGFGQASQFSSMKNPLIPVQAKFFAGVCYDLLNEGETALSVYEDVFRETKKLEGMIPKGAVSRYDRTFWDKFEDTMETVFDIFSYPGDVVEEWFEKRGKDYQEKQRFLEILIRSKNELEPFLENLLNIIIARKGVSREEYLKPYTPKPTRFGRLNIPNLRVGQNQRPQQRILGGGQRPIRQLPGIRCFKCNTIKRLGTCPICQGTGKYRGTGRVTLQLNCTRCSGTGRSFVCQCDRPLGTNLINTGRKTCLVCRGKGQISNTGGMTWVPCNACNGRGYF